MGCRSADRWRIFVIPSGVEESLISKRGFLDLAWTKMVRDVSTSLDMTKGSTERGSDTVAGSFSAVFVIPSEVEESLTISGNPHDNNFRRDGKRRRRCCRPSFSVLSGVASSEASRMGLGISNF